MQSFQHTYQLGLICALLISLNASALAQTGYERPPIDYLNGKVEDPVTRLAEEVEAGKTSLEYDEEHGYLAAVLKALDIPQSSQTLVFSKTSLQLHRISPRRPRAIYFNDDVYVGFCQRGDVLELAATDARQGAVFYTLKQTPNEPPKFVRDRGQCLTCHASNRTQGVPGYLIRSVFADSSGQPILGSGTYTTDHTSPLDERWGGWYVTGTHGSMRHMGNQTYHEDDARTASRESGANLRELDGFFATSAYLTPHSDIVALMVMEHQTQMHNALAAANYETRLALHQSFQMNELLEREPGFVSESAQRRIEAAANNVVKYLLLCDEFKLQSPLAGTSNYKNEFEARGIRDSEGRSLRDLDLETRLFRYPCSYLIYSEAFEGLPERVRDRILTRLVEILQGEDDSVEFSHLSQATREAILEILLQTKPEIESYLVRLESAPPLNGS